jgi:predicted RND superfamily exporter protein
MSADLDKMIDFKEENALITARIQTNSTEEIREVLNEIKKEAQNYGEGSFPLIGGFGDLLSELVNAVVRGQIISLFLSILLVAVVVMLLFKSFIAGFYAAVRLIAALVSLFSLMGFLNIKLDMITTMLSSIMIGVGVDYTIHFLWRYREERRNLDKKEAVIKTLTTSGRGITFNALSVIVGFSILFVSGFLPVQFFAFLVTVSIATCLIGALLILPALVLVFEPKFLEDK